MARQDLKLGHNRFLPYPFQLIIHYHIPNRGRHFGKYSTTELRIKYKYSSMASVPIQATLN